MNILSILNCLLNYFSASGFSLIYLTVAFAMVGKFGITASFGSIFLFTPELFPTTIRYGIISVILSTSNRIPTTKKGSHVYLLLQIFCVKLLFWPILQLFDINVVLMLPWWPDVTIVQSDITMTMSIFYSTIRP